MSEATRVTEKGQATIPKHLREKYDLEPGDEVVWVESDDGILVKKRTTEARGMLVSKEVSDAERQELANELGESIRCRDDNYAGE